MPAADLNGIALESAPYTAAPLPDPYQANLGVAPSRFRCFRADSGAVVEGQNLIKVTLTQPTPESASKVTLDYLDVFWL